LDDSNTNLTPTPGAEALKIHFLDGKRVANNVDLIIYSTRDRHVSKSDCFRRFALIILSLLLFLSLPGQSIDGGRQCPFVAISDRTRLKTKSKRNERHMVSDCKKKTGTFR
jgi:hypothetical protein